jgi:hypothetical protein
MGFTRAWTISIVITIASNIANVNNEEGLKALLIMLTGSEEDKSRCGEIQMPPLDEDNNNLSPH